MTSQIITLGTSTQPDGSFSVNGVFWLVAPSTRVIPIPKFQSQAPQISAANLLSLQQGTLVEQSFTTGLFASSSVMADVEALLASMYSDAQSALNALGPTLSGLVGHTFDGTTWTTSSPPTSAWITAQTPPVSADGRPLRVHTITKFTRNFQLRSFSFQTSNPSSLHNASPITSMSDVTYKCFDNTGTDVTSSPTTAVTTQIDFMPSYSYEVIGGWMDAPDTTHTAIMTAGPGFWYISAVGVPDIPSIYGGSIPFVYEVDVALVPSGQQRIESEAGAVSFLQTSGSSTNKMRWIVKHPIGGQQWFQLFLKTYV